MRGREGEWWEKDRVDVQAKLEGRESGEREGGREGGGEEGAMSK